MSVKISFKLQKILTHNYFSFPKKLVNIRYVYTYISDLYFWQGKPNTQRASFHSLPGCMIMKRRNLTPKLICIFQFKKVFSFSLIYKTQNVFNIVLFLLEIYNVLFKNWRRDILGVKHICHQIKQSMQLKECFLIPVGFFSSSFPWKNRFCGTTKYCKILN